MYTFGLGLMRLHISDYNIEAIEEFLKASSMSTKNDAASSKHRPPLQDRNVESKLKDLEGGSHTQNAETETQVCRSVEKQKQEAEEVKTEESMGASPDEEKPKKDKDDGERKILTIVNGFVAFSK